MCNGNCPDGLCSLCDMSVVEQQDFCEEQARIAFEQAESNYMLGIAKSTDQIASERQSELDRLYQYFLLIGENPEQARKSANIDYMMSL